MGSNAKYKQMIDELNRERDAKKKALDEEYLKEEQHRLKSLY